MTAPVQARENTSADARSATDHGPRTTDSAPADGPRTTDSAPAALSTQDSALSTSPPTTDSARTAANRLNALKSTGPRTAAGKAKSALNALKHGLTSQSPLLPTEDPADYNLFAEGYLEELNPQSVEQFNLAQQLILTSWKLNRIPQIEAKVLAEYTDRHPVLVKWRKDCADLEYQNATRRHPLPLPEKPAIPSTTTDDLIALSFFPKPPTPGTPTTGEPLGAALQRLRQYHTTLLNTYLKLLKKYESSQNEPIQPATDDLSNLTSEISNLPASPATTDHGPLTTDSAPAAQIEPIPLAANNLSNLKSEISQVSTLPASPPATDHGPLTTDY